MTMNRKTINSISLSVGTVLLLGIGVASCSGGNDTAAEPAAPSVTAEQPAEQQPVAAEQPAGPHINAWNDTNAWPDGMAVTLSAPTAYTPSDVAAGTEGFSTFAQWTITLMNGTDEPVNPMAVQVAVTSGGVAGSWVVDATSSAGMPPTGDVLPGQSVSWNATYGVTDPADIQVQISPSFDQDAYWSGALS